MLPTHVNSSIFLISLAAATFSFELSAILLSIVLVASIFPDLDMIVGIHRKTLHPVVVYAAVTALITPIFFLSQNTIIGYLGLFTLFCTIHTAVDVLGTGAEKRPWEHNNDNAIYSASMQKWLKARRVFNYDGSPLDLIVLMASTAAIFYTANLPQMFEILIFTLLVIGIIYTAVRRTLPKLEEYFFENSRVIRVIIKIIRSTRPLSADEAQNIENSDNP